jgi:molybdate transport system regulatory protein
MAHRKSSSRSRRSGEGQAETIGQDGCLVTGRLWVERHGETWLAWGRVVLLERVREHGSISAAARSMKMGYRHAWELIDSMNRLAPTPLVEKAAGGRGGGGARLTAAGERMVSEYWRMVDDYRTWLADKRPRFDLEQSDATTHPEGEEP